MGLKLAVLGATGNVGREIMTILDERLFEADEVIALASRDSIGKEVTYGEKTLKCRDVETFDFATVDLVLMSAGSGASEKYGRKAAEAGALVIDNSSYFRMDEDVPLIVPEVNADAIEGARESLLIANPNCSTIQLVAALKPLHDAATIKRVVASTYQSVSGAGRGAMDELWTQTRGIFVNDPIETEQFTKQIAFNVIPHIDEFMSDGDTKEEWKMREETKKILDPSVELTATCVRVPVFVGHAVAANIEFEEGVSPGAARKLLREAPGLMLVDKREDGGYVTPVESVGEFAVFISRIRRDPTNPNALNLWIVADNLRKGAALNAVQIAELAKNRGFFD